MMRYLFTFMMTRAILQKSAPAEKVNQHAMVSTLPVMPGGGGFISPVIMAQKLGEAEQIIADLQDQLGESISIDVMVDRLDKGLKEGKLTSEKIKDFISIVIDSALIPELRISITRPGRETIKAEIESAIGAPAARAPAARAPAPGARSRS
jgi:hypothetical protein